MRLSASRFRYLGFGTFLFALLQVVCPAVVALSGLRIVIGVSAVAAAAGLGAFLQNWHQDAVRIPMMAISLLGATLNLFVIWQIRRLRARPSAQWRAVPVTAAKLRSERIQILLSLLTFVLLAAEWLTHLILHRPRA
jgi:hypothetical protein